MDGMEAATGMMATGVGLGIMTMGAMIPIVVMKNIVENGGTVRIKGQKQMKIDMPKINLKMNANLPKATVKRIRLK